MIPTLVAPRANAALEVIVLYTGMPETAEALASVREWARELHASIKVLIPYVVPWALPLERPPVSVEFLQSRFAALLTGQPIETQVIIGLCRDREQFIEGSLRPGSTVVIRGRRSRLVRRLSALGHHVILI